MARKENVKEFATKGNDGSGAVALGPSPTPTNKTENGSRDVINAMTSQSPFLHFPRDLMTSVEARKV